MAPKKLTEADKVAILGLYRQPEETTSTLAERYGVSNSTISRLLKASLPEAEYKLLIHQKRGVGDRDIVPGADFPTAAPSAEPISTEPAIAEPASLEGTPALADAATAAAPPAEPSKAPPILKKRGAVADPLVPSPEATPPDETTTLASSSDSDSVPALQDRQGQAKRQRSRSRVSSALTPVESPVKGSSEEATQLALSTDASSNAAPDTLEGSPSVTPARPAPVKKTALAKATDPEDVWDDNAPTLDDDYGEEEDDDDEEDDWDGDASTMAPHLEVVEIVPLTPSDLPPQCYLVVERVSSELVVLPLKTFASLGQIPEEEGDHRTLPVFDNHRVARRFSRRNQRVIKVPDGNLLQTTRPYLQAKGITRLLIDGHVFALEEDKGVETLV